VGFVLLNLQFMALFGGATELYVRLHWFHRKVLTDSQTDCNSSSTDSEGKTPMSNWKSCLKADPTNWLLEKSNPSVRYLTLLNILNRNKADSEVKRAKKEIMVSGVVPRVINRQIDGSWNSPGRFYVDKYKGTVWQIIILAELEADANNKQVSKACEYILNASQDLDSYGFSYNQRGGNLGGRHSEVIPCLTGNMIWSLVKLGYFKDDRVRKGIDWIAKYQRFDDGADQAPKGWPYDRFEMCWGRHSCHMGVAKALKALSAIPKSQRNENMNQALKQGCEYLLAHHIYKQSHNLSKTAKPSWLKLQFPLMYQTDILECAQILLYSGFKDKRMQDSIEKILSKQNDKGRWNLEATFNGRFQVNIEAKGKPSKWITYRAMNVLKKYHENKDEA
jgi:hypothetical protein